MEASHLGLVAEMLPSSEDELWVPSSSSFFFKADGLETANKAENITKVLQSPEVSLYLRYLMHLESSSPVLKGTADLEQV